MFQMRNLIEILYQMKEIEKGDNMYYIVYPTFFLY